MQYDERAEFERDMAELEYLKRCHEVECVACKIQKIATEHLLRQDGWYLSTKGEFCPEHSDYPAHQALVDQTTRSAKPVIDTRAMAVSR